MRRHERSSFYCVLVLLFATCLALPAAVEAGTAYTTTITGTTTVAWDNASVWGGSGYPGDGSESPLGSDTATVTFNDNISGTAYPKMDLNGGSFAIAGLTIVETGDNAAGDFLSTTGATGNVANATAGTLAVSQIVYESGNREIDFGFIARNLPTDVNGDPDMGRNLTIDGGATELLIRTGSSVNTVNGRTDQLGSNLDFNGNTTGTGGLRVEGDRNVFIEATGFSVGGTVTLAKDRFVTGFAGLQENMLRFDWDVSPAATTANLDTVTIDELVIESNGQMRLDRLQNPSDATYLKVTGMTTVSNDMWNFYAADGGGNDVYLQGGLTLSNGDADVRLHLGNSADVRVETGFYGGDETLIKTGRSVLEFQGNVNTVTRTGDTIIRHGTIDVDNNSQAVFSLGTGDITIEKGASLRLANAQTTFPTKVTVEAFGALGEDLAGAVYSGTGQNVFLTTNSILSDATHGNATGTNPTRSEVAAMTLGTGHDLYADITANTATYNFDDDGSTTIFKGAAFAGSARDGFRGVLETTAADVSGAQDLNIVVLSNPRTGDSQLINFLGSGSLEPTLNSATEVVNITLIGGGQIQFETRDSHGLGGNWTTMNIAGEAASIDEGLGGVNPQQQNIVRLERVGASDTGMIFRNGQTVNISEARFQFDNDAAAGSNSVIETGATVNIQTGATLYLDRPYLGGGVIHIDADAKLRYDNAAELGNNVGVLNNITADSGFTVILDTDTANPGANANVDAFVQQAGTVILDDDGADNMHVTLGNGAKFLGRYLGNVDLTGANSGLSHATNTAGDTIQFAAAVTQTESANFVRQLDLNISNGGDFSNVDLTVGSTTTERTVGGGGDMQSVDANMWGRVFLDAQSGATNSRFEFNSIRVESGQLRVYGDLMVHGDLVFSSEYSEDEQIFDDAGTDIVVMGNIIINEDASAPTSPAPGNNPASTFNSGDARRLFIDDETTLQAGLEAGTMAQGSNGIEIRDYGHLHLHLDERGTSTDVVDINQRITIANTGANFNPAIGAGTDGVLRVEGIGSANNYFNFADIQLEDGSVFGVNEGGNTKVTATFNIRGASPGTATILDDGNADDFDLTGVTADEAGSVLVVGTTASLFTTNLLGTVGSNVTLDLARANFDVDGSAGGQIQGSAVVRSGSTLDFEDNDATIGGDLAVLGTGTVNFTGGASQVTVGGMLSGDGTVNGDVGATGTVAPGQSPGILTVTGDFQFLGASTFEVEIDGTTPGTGYDQLVVGGEVTIDTGAELKLLLGIEPPMYQQYTLIVNNSSTPVAGIFSQLSTPVAEGGVVYGEFAGLPHTFTISYFGNDGNDVVLTAVPEPSTIVTLLTGLLALAFYLRRRKR